MGKNGRQSKAVNDNEVIKWGHAMNIKAKKSNSS
jgi:hypothetical protein